ncbi:MAG: hypothetical protein KF883_05135 [Thermomicrobiales bacterium]|nr:hypothetical protein [Thermomicrobiales bacterium]
MSPYVSFGLAMCAICLIALAGTSYLAYYFNRKAKDDLERALAPLAGVLEGKADVEEAIVTGRYRGHLSTARVSMLPGGMGRVFQIALVDGAGGQKWTWTLSRSKEGGPPSGVFEHEPADIPGAVQPLLDALTSDPALIEGWFRVEYDPEAGHVQLTRPMHNRRDIPGVETFSRFLDDLYDLAGANRSVQAPGT